MDEQLKKKLEEAIAWAKEWLKDNAHDYSFSNEGCDALLADFESDMNKYFGRTEYDKK